MLDLGCAYAKGQSPKAAVAGSMAVAAYNRSTGQRETLFWSDNMDDALLNVGSVDIGNAKLRRVAFQRFQLLRAFGIGDRHMLAIAVQTRGSG